MNIYPVTVKKTKIMKKSWGMAQKSTFAKKYYSMARRHSSAVTS